MQRVPEVPPNAFDALLKIVRLGIDVSDVKALYEATFQISKEGISASDIKTYYLIVLGQSHFLSNDQHFEPTQSQQPLTPEDIYTPPQFSARERTAPIPVETLTPAAPVQWETPAQPPPARFRRYRVWIGVHSHRRSG